MVPGKAEEAPLLRGVCSVEMLAAVSAKEVPEPPRAFSLQSNHVFTLPQRSVLILTSHWRMRKLKPAIEVSKTWISLELSSISDFSAGWAKSLV